MVGLSELDSKNYSRILEVKHRLHLIPEVVAKDPSEGREQFNNIITTLRQHPKRLGSKAVEEVINKYGSGISTYQLGKEYGCNRQTISAILKRNNVMPTNRKAQRKFQIEDLICLYNEKKTIAEIARIYEVDPSTILKVLKENGVKMRNRWDYKNEDTTK